MKGATCQGDTDGIISKPGCITNRNFQGLECLKNRRLETRL